MILVSNNEGTLGVPTTARLLSEGAHALDAIEAGISLIEADPSVRTVGRGGWPNLLCEMERALQGGLLSRVTIHAIDTRGNHKVVAVNGTGDNTYWLWPGHHEPRSERAEPVAIHSNELRPTATTRYAYGR